MTQVNFYTLPDEEVSSKWQFACRLCEKVVVTLGHRVFIRVVSAEESKLLDDLLWTFRPASFLPHALANTSSDPRTAVLIGSGECPIGAAEVLINLCSDPDEPPHQQFTYINEIILADAESLAAGRKRYRFYQSLGYQLATYKR